MPARGKKPLRRDASFLGVQFVPLGGPRAGNIGRNVTRSMVRRIIKTVGPDYIQCQAKGPSGLSLYPTEAGHAAGGLSGDPLRIWRDVTRARGVALYVRYSGLQDAEAVRRHRSWARVRADEKRDRETVSVFGPYADELLLPQLKELAGTYGVDGAWVEEVSAVAPDYAKAAAKAFRKEAGVRRLPTKPTHKHWPTFAAFCREAFRRHFRRWVDEVHVAAPEFQVGSSGAFGAFMPEPVTADVDFLCGEVSPWDSVNAARLAGRCLVRQGKPWDLMLWGFRRRPGHACLSTKTAEQLKQEAAVVVSLGGGVSVCFGQKPDGAIYGWQVDLMAEVARFCRQRRTYCHGAEPVPQVALLYAGGAYDQSADRLMGSAEAPPEATAAVLRVLLGLHYSVEVTMEHHLAGRMAAYPLIIVPDGAKLAPDVRDRLLAYVEGGGNLLVIGPAAARPVADALAVTFKGKDRVREQWLAVEGHLAAMETLSAQVALNGPARGIGRLYGENDARGDGWPAASVVEYGQGKIAAVYVNLGERFARASTSVARRFLEVILQDLFPEPMVEIDGRPPVDVVVNRVRGQLAVNLINTGGPHADPCVETFDRVPPLGSLKVRIRTGWRPERVFLQPGNRHLPFRFREGAVEVTLGGLGLHEIITFEDAGRGGE